MYVLIVLVGIVSWLEKNMFTCPSKKYLGIACFGCGFQRSFLAMCKGNFKECLIYYPAMPLVLFVVIFTGLHLWFKFTHGATIIKYAFILMAFTIVINYFIKLFNPIFFSN